VNLIERAAERLARQAATAHAPAARGGEPAAAPQAEEIAADAFEPQAHGPGADTRAADPSSPAGTPADGARADVESRPRRSRAGVIDLDRLRQAGMIPPPDGAAIVEEFREIARPILAAASAPRDPEAPPANVVLLTSALAGEGKTFCAINLALTVAMESQRHVLLVDADVAKPAVATTLGLDVDLGLVDCLLDSGIDLADALIRTDMPHLTILAAGRERRYGADLLGSLPMARLLDELARRYRDRVILVDAPPVLSTPDVAVLAPRVGQTVLVVEADRTPQADVKEALSRLTRCPSVALLLNKRTSARRVGVALEPDVPQEE
jgi:protein-tyrosine kinase